MYNSVILRFKVTLGKKVYEIDLSKELEFNPNNIQKEVCTQASKYAWFSSLHESSRYLLKCKERDLEELYSDLEYELKTSWKHRFKPTENSVKNCILRDQRYRNLRRQVEKLQYQTNQLLAAKKDFEMRKDLLIQVSANNRAELNQQL